MSKIAQASALSFFYSKVIVDWEEKCDSRMAKVINTAYLYNINTVRTIHLKRKNTSAKTKNSV